MAVELGIPKDLSKAAELAVDEHMALFNVSSFEAARYRDFDPTEFGSPPEDWQPPYPSYWEDASFVRVNV